MILAARVALVLIALLAAPAMAAERIALLIGNGAYQNHPVLPNPVNDTADLAGALRAAGFEVEEHENLSQIRLLSVLRDFQHRALSAKVAVIYYSGHGMEVERRNFLIPVDARLETDRDIAFEAVPLEAAMFAVEGASELSLVIVDACRDNPFLAQMTRTMATRSIGLGLGRVEPPGNTLVAFAAREGTVAYDGEGRNSPYAEALIEAVGAPGLEIGKLFRRVRDRVLETTNGRQEPFLYGSLSEEDYFLNPPAPGEPAPVPDPGPAPGSAAALEIAFWEAIADSTDPRDFEDYLARYPGGTFRSLAERRLASLRPADPEAPEADASPEAAPEAPAFRPSRAQIRDAQARLNALGHDAGPVDGLMGRRTAEAVAAFQRAQGLTPDGAVSEALLATLSAEVSETDLAAWRARMAPSAEPAPSAPAAAALRPGRYCLPGVRPEAGHLLVERLGEAGLRIVTVRQGVRGLATGYQWDGTAFSPGGPGEAVTFPAPDRMRRGGQSFSAC